MLTAPVRIQSVHAEYSGHILINQKMELSQNEISPSFMNITRSANIGQMEHCCLLPHRLSKDEHLYLYRGIQNCKFVPYIFFAQRGTGISEAEIRLVSLPPMIMSTLSILCNHSFNYLTKKTMCTEVKLCYC